MKLKYVSAIAGLIAFMGTTVACSSPTLTPTLAPTAMPTATPLPGTPPPAPATTSVRTPTAVYTLTPAAKDLTLAALSSAINKIKTYRVKVPEEGRVIEVVLPDRYHQVEPDEIFRIGALYIDMTVDRRDTIGSVPYMDRVNLLWFRDQVSKSAQSAFLGPATIDGVQCIGYSSVLPLVRIIPPKTPGNTPELSQLSETVKIWFGTTDGFPRRIEYGPPISVTVNFYDYNASIEINPP